MERGRHLATYERVELYVVGLRKLSWRGSCRSFERPRHTSYSFSAFSWTPDVFLLRCRTKPLPSMVLSRNNTFFTPFSAIPGFKNHSPRVTTFNMEHKNQRVKDEPQVARIHAKLQRHPPRFLPSISRTST